MSGLRLSADQCSMSPVRWQPATSVVFGPVMAGWRIAEPLPVEVVRDGDDMIVSDGIFNIYGIGASWDAAFGDYKASLVGFFELMSDSEEPGSRRIVERLSFYLKRER